MTVAAASGCSFDTAGIATGMDAPDPGATDATGAIDAAQEIDARVPTYVAYWSFDVDASDATGVHDGVLAGQAAITSGTRGFGGGEALVLTGDGDRVDVGGPTAFDFNSDFTWHAYVKTSDSSGAILSRNPLASDWNQGSKALFVRDSRIQWDTGWVSNPQTQVEVVDDQWHQVIVTFESESDRLQIFVDPGPGATDGDYDGTHEVDRFDEHTHLHNDGVAHTGFSIGQANFTGGLASLDTLVGLIDEVAIFDRVIAGAELDQLISDGPASF